MQEVKLKPSELRAWVLDEHVQIRATLSEMESLAGRAVGDAHCLAQLRAKTIELYNRLDAHMSMEEALLYPAIYDADAWGHVRAARMKEDHARQRVALGQLVDMQWRPDTAELVRAVQSFAQDIRDDICAEEGELLNPELLRDDVISIAQNSG